MASPGKTRLVASPGTWLAGDVIQMQLRRGSGPWTTVETHTVVTNGVSPTFTSNGLQVNGTFLDPSPPPSYECAIDYGPEQARFFNATQGTAGSTFTNGSCCDTPVNVKYLLTSNYTGTYNSTTHYLDLGIPYTSTLTIDGDTIPASTPITGGSIVLTNQTGVGENGIYTDLSASNPLGTGNRVFLKNNPTAGGQLTVANLAYVAISGGNTGLPYSIQTPNPIFYDDQITFAAGLCAPVVGIGSPGPAGPAGPTGPTGPAGPSLTLKNAGSTLGTITSLDVTGTGIAASISGSAGTLTGSASATSMNWTGDWAGGVAYAVNDVVRLHNDPNSAGYGNGYVCTSAHTSSPGNIPPNLTYWAATTDVSGAIKPADKTFLQGLTDGVFDWIKDAVNNGDWLSLLAAGVGVAVAGVVINDMFSSDGTGDGNADSRFDGTAGYNTAITAVNLQTVVTSIMTFIGKTAPEFDVTLLPTTPCNFTIAQTMTCGNLLANLALAYQFDIVPSGGVVKFVPKYVASVRTLTASDMGHVAMSAGNEITGSAAYTARRAQGIDLPRSVTLNYYSSDLDYNVFSQVATLETYTEGQDVKLEVPFTLSDAEAKRIAESALVNAHIERQTYTMVTDMYNIDLEVADVITIPLDTGGTTDARIIQVSSQDDGLIEFTLSRADQNTNTYVASTVAGTTPADQTTNVPTVIGYSSALFIEVPPLSDADSTPRYFAAVHGYGAAGWPGAAVYRSTDGGATYDSVVTSYGQVTMGKMSTVSAAPPDYHVWDDTTVLTVVMKQGTLVSAPSDLAVQNGANQCMIGEEVIGFRTATLVALNTYQLTRLMRGRLGTETKCSTHVADELFIMLDNTLTQIDVQPADLGKTVKYKVVTIGSDISKATAIDVKPYGLNMRPWTVAVPKAVRDLTTNDWTISWIERPRYQNQLRDYTEITHDIDWGGFAIAIMSGSTVKFTATSVTDTYVYTSAQQIIDWGSNQTTLTASIVQLSTVVGGGAANVVTV